MGVDTVVRCRVHLVTEVGVDIFVGFESFVPPGLIHGVEIHNLSGIAVDLGAVAMAC